MDYGFWMILIDSPIKKFFSNVNTPFNAEIIVGKMDDKEKIKLYEIYRVDYDYPLRINYFGSWSSSNNNIYFNKNHIYARRYDLEGKLLRVGSIEVSNNNNNNNLFVSYFPFN